MIAHGPVEPFHIGVLLELARLDVFELDAPVICPSLDRCTDVLGAVITLNDLWLAPPGNNLLQGSDHTLGRQQKVYLDAQGFAVEVINHIEQSEAPAIFELVVHEIHGPDFVHGQRHAQRFGLLADQPLAWFDAQFQLQLPVNPVDPLVVPLEPFDIAQIQVTQPKAPGAVVVRQSQQPIGNLLVSDLAWPRTGSSFH